MKRFFILTSLLLIVKASWALAPASQVTKLGSSSVSSSSAMISWTPGGGDGRIVVMSTSPISGTPGAGVDYSASANSVFGLGAEITTGEFVVYSGNGSSFQVTGLSLTTTYYFVAFEYTTNPSYAYLTTVGTNSNSLTTTCLQPLGNSGSLSICSGAKVNFDLSSSISNSVPSTFTWLATADDPSISGESTTLQTSGIIDDVLMNESTTDVDVIYSVTPTSASACQGLSFTVTVTVHSAPQLDPGLDKTICAESDAGVFFNTTGDVSAASYTINAITRPTDLIPGADNAKTGSDQTSDAISKDRWTNASTSSRTVSYEVVPVSMEGCAGNAGYVVITVNPIPVLSVTNSSPDIQSGESTNITFYDLMGIPGVTYSFDASANGYVTGASSSPNGNSIVQQLTNSNLNSPAKIDYTVKATTPNGCEATDLKSVNVASPFPTQQSTKLGFINITSVQASISFTPGDGANHLVVIKEGAPVDGIPVNGTVYESADPAFGKGDEIGSGNFVVYKGSGSSVTVSGLKPMTDYFVQVFDFNGTSYLTTTDSNDPFFTTGDEPTIQSQDLVFSSLSSNSANITFTPGNGTHHLVVVRASASSEVDPTTGSAYTANAAFGLGDVTGAGNYVVYNGTGTRAVVTGLTPLTIYFVRVYDFNGTTYLLDKPKGYPSTFTTLAPPSRILAADSLALVALYNATGGTGWNLKTNWLTGQVGDWYGVTTTGTRVTGLSLIGNNLNGPLPAELTDLTALTELRLNDNTISGSIPANIGDLVNLTHLSLSQNQFAGNIPASLSNLTGLNILELSVNQLTGSIPAFVNFSSLSSLDLGSNQLTGSIPSGITNLTGLQFLNLNNNQLSGAVPDLAKITGLSTVDLRNNQLTVLPNLSSANFNLNVSDNFFTFEDLEPNVTLTKFVYAPQKSFGTPDSKNSVIGQPLNLSFTVGGSANSYQWKLNGLLISALSPNPSYSVSSFSAINAGTYTLSVTNSLVPGLTLTSAPVTVTVHPPIDYYWIGNGGDWKNLAHWSLTSGGAVAATTLPGPNDNVFFDANSFTQTGQVVSIADDGSKVGVSFKSMDWRGVKNNPTFQVRAVTSDWIANTCNGSLYFADNMTLDFNQAEFHMESNTDYEFDARNHPMGQKCWLQFNALFPVKGNILSDINHAWIYVDRGTLNFNGHSFTDQPDNYPGLWIAGTNATPATVNVSNSNIDVGTIQMSNFSTLIDDNAVITVRNRMNVRNQNFNYVKMASVTMAPAAGNNTFETLELLPGADVKLLTATTQTVNNLIAKGTAAQPISLKSTTAGAPVSISKSTGKVNAKYIHLQDINAVGGATFNAIDSWDDGNNKGWNFLFTNSPADSLALVNLYNSTRGVEWTTKTNWLTGNLNTWYGVTIDNKGRVSSLKLSNNNLNGTWPTELSVLDRLTLLDLSKNKLAGAIPSNVTGLAFLKKLNASDNALTGAVPALPVKVTSLRLEKNKLTDLPAIPDSLISANLSFNRLDNLGDFSKKKVDSLQVQNNKLSFEDLEPNISIRYFTYSNQDSVDVRESYLKQVNETQTFTATTGGTANSYQWKKNTVAIAGSTKPSLTVSNISFADDAVYFYEATNSKVPGLTLVSYPKVIRVSSLRRDSIALRALYLATGGANWTNKTNWLTTPLRSGSWAGVTIANNRVTGLSLPSNNLVGKVPAVLGDIANMTTLNLSSNKIQSLPDLRSLSALTTFNVSNNQLDFASLIPNAGMKGINYATQADIGTAVSDQIDYGKEYTLKISTKGTGNVYQWKRAGTAVAGATDSTYYIKSINRNNMGDYIAEVTNPSVPGLTLKSARKRVTAIASVSGKVFANTTSAAKKGTVTLFRIVKGSSYDTISVKNINGDGTFKFDKVELDDYQVVSFVDTVTYARALPTYYKNTIYWEEATTIPVDANVTDVDIVSNYKPSEVPKGTGMISGYLEVDDGKSGRTKAKQRVDGAGASVRRVERTGRPQGETLTLVAYVFSDANGVFTIPNLPKGEYRLNIQLPGYPMDESSYLTIPIGDGLQSQVKVAATVEKGKAQINVKKLTVTGVWEEAGYVAEAYPNPSVNFVTVKFNETSSSRSLELLDATGRSVVTQPAPEKENTLDVQSYPAGVYLLRISDQNAVRKVLRLVIE